MRRDAADVFHDAGGILENGGVEALQNITAADAVAGGCAPGVVDVSAAERFRLQKFAGQLKSAGDGANIGFEIHAANFSASMAAVAMAATTTATAAAATGFFARVSIVAGAGGGEGGKFLVELGGAAMRTFGAAPFGGADEDLGIAFALGAMKFVDRHGSKIVFPAAMFKRDGPPAHHGRAPLSFFFACGSFSRALPARTSMRNGGSISGGNATDGGSGSATAEPASTILPMTASSSGRP